MPSNTLATAVTQNVLNAVAPHFNEIKTSLGSLELKVSGLGIQMDQMNSKIDLSLELTTTVPQLEIMVKNHDERLEKIETDLHVLKLAVSRSESS